MDDVEFWMSGLRPDDKSIGLIVNRLALECHEFALGSGIPSRSVEGQLSLAFEVLESYLDDLIKVSPVVAASASGIAIVVSLDPEAYRRAAAAAKDRIAAAVH